MNDEVKLILTKLKIVSEEKENGCYICDREHSKLLLSYIEQLQSLCNKYEQEHKTTFEIWKKDIEKLKQLENNRYKAIEYVEEKGRLKYNPNELLNILRGGSYDDLMKENNKLQSNWNSLRGWLEEYSQDLEFRCYMDMVLDKMNELEGKDKDEREFKERY